VGHPVGPRKPVFAKINGAAVPPKDVWFRDSHGNQEKKKNAAGIGERREHFTGKNPLRRGGGGGGG